MTLTDSFFRYYSFNISYNIKRTNTHKHSHPHPKNRNYIQHMSYLRFMSCDITRIYISCLFFFCSLLCIFVSSYFNVYKSHYGCYWVQRRNKHKITHESKLKQFKVNFWSVFPLYYLFLNGILFINEIWFMFVECTFFIKPMWIMKYYRESSRKLFWELY